MAKAVAKLPVYVALDALLAALDVAPVGPEQPILRKSADKEHYETLLMFSVRKRQAAQHHLQAIERMLDAATKTAIQEVAAASMSLPSGPVHSYKASVLTSAAEYVHELAAFLAALRSGLDFLAQAAGRSLKGVKARSMHTLETLVDKGFDAPVLAVVKAHQVWLKALRDYRDEVVHRLVVPAPASGWVVSHKGKTASARLPIVVPRRTPALLTDTRRSRAREAEADAPTGFAVRESHATITYADGSQAVLKHDIAYEPADGYVRIEQLMTEYLAAYDAFMIELLGVLSGIVGQQTLVQPPKADTP